MSSELRQQTSSNKLAEAQAVVQRGMQLRQHVNALRKSSDVAGKGNLKQKLAAQASMPNTSIQAQMKQSVHTREGGTGNGTPKFSLNKKDVNQKSSEIFQTAEFPSAGQNKDNKKL